ncbi:Autophagy-related protein 22 [Hondaea fermentalgiana]|uniref:Autophagy-related protein 22 n=1 Tax=Hondaea fermentalgiana TaxID=2315210 RepID=A0A2R5GGI5_9STRA|nr:Autophagy-related protein 22 [Hondaea fermentalgiana]|eukprot:GBG28868.1 Autophagy-related protein 22 [Hondaea fermentalgiana]
MALNMEMDEVGVKGDTKSFSDRVFCLCKGFAPDNAEARGYVYCCASRGTTSIYASLFASVALNAFALSVSDCDGEIFSGAIKASSLVSSLGVVEGVLNALLSPFLGSIADLTPHRKRGLGISFCIFLGMVLVQALFFLSKDSDKLDPEDEEGIEYLQRPLWQSDVALLILCVSVIIQVVSYEIAALMTQSYSSELSRDDLEVTRYVGLGYTTLNSMQLLLAAVVTGISLVAGFSSFQQGTVGGFIAFILALFWFIPGFRMLGERKTVDPEFSRSCCGLKHIGQTLGEILTKYPELLKFLVSWALGSGAVTSVAILSTSYLQFHLGYDGVLTSAVMALALFFSVPGSLLTHRLTRYLSLKAIYILVLVIYGISFILGPAVLLADSVPVNDVNATATLTQYGLCDFVITGDTEETRQEPASFTFYLLLVFTVTWGLCLGALYVISNSLFAALIPGGKESSFFGIKILFAKVLTWLPPLLFTTINEQVDSLRWAIVPLGPLFLLAAIVAFFIDFEKGKAHIADTMHRRPNVDRVGEATLAMRQLTLAGFVKTRPQAVQGVQDIHGEAERLNTRLPKSAPSSQGPSSSPVPEKTTLAQAPTHETDETRALTEEAAPAELTKSASDPKAVSDNEHPGSDDEGYAESLDYETRRRQKIEENNAFLEKKAQVMNEIGIGATENDTVVEGTSTPIYASSGLDAVPQALPRAALQTWQDDSLKRIYALDAHPSRAIVAAAGHGGRVSVFAAQHEDPVMSFKAFRGWCSSVHFVGNTSLLLGASNDGGLTLFDTNLIDETDGAPRIVANGPSDLHASGIFSMHVNDHLVATASKDASVALCRVTENSDLVVTERFPDLHGGVVKSVRLRDQNTFASTGNDVCLHVCDIRTKSVSVTIDNVHEQAANSVRWRNEHQLMTTSFGPEMRLFDIRAPRPSNPVAEYVGHAPRPRTIYHPLFSSDGKYVTVCGDHRVTTFDVDSKETLYIGGLDFSPTALCLDSLAHDEGADSKHDLSRRIYVGGPRTVVTIALGET